MSKSFQNEIPRARINIKLNLVTGGSQKKVELPLKLLSVGDYSNGRAQGTLSEREKININKNNFNCVLADLHPEVGFLPRKAVRYSTLPGRRHGHQPVSGSPDAKSEIIS